MMKSVYEVARSARAGYMVLSGILALAVNIGFTLTIFSMSPASRQHMGIGYWPALSYVVGTSPFTHLVLLGVLSDYKLSALLVGLAVALGTIAAGTGLLVHRRHARSLACAVAIFHLLGLTSVAIDSLFPELWHGPFLALFVFTGMTYCSFFVPRRLLPDTSLH